MKFNFTIQSEIIAVFAIMIAVFACGCEEDPEIPPGVYTATGEGYLTTSDGKKDRQSVPELAFSIHLDSDNGCTLYRDEDGDGVFDDFVESGYYTAGGGGYGFIDLKMKTQAYCLRLWYTLGDDTVLNAESPSLCMMKFNNEDGSRFSYCYVLEYYL